MIEKRREREQERVHEQDRERERGRDRENERGRDRENERGRDRENERERDREKAEIPKPVGRNYLNLPEILRISKAEFNGYKVCNKSTYNRLCNLCISF